MLLSLLFLAATVSASSASDVDQVLRVASDRFPRVHWNRAQARVADFTFDGVQDVALLGFEDHEAVVAVVVGPLNKHSRILHLRIRERTFSEDDGLCGSARDASLSLEEPGLDGEDDAADTTPLGQFLAKGAARGGQALRLDGGDCDAFHILFDGKRLVWWRR